MAGAKAKTDPRVRAVACPNVLAWAPLCAPRPVISHPGKRMRTQSEHEHKHT
eukprot:CAMPEP_0206139596 /NCGR_PEP_ID=MMETSP1473-20131121/6663_1 /ASSEMBLY_ACC=CAM_ASM_001109 /TAXON_ID=1461547 /ORGANISM="Stichococcus sp, Strain RCC1054" /LENGTH=51 /DNA_ID=CAMNT_0053533455 /DNA_START=122 /DNA_END=274 /DNA_ORIENTATION=+